MDILSKITLADVISCSLGSILAFIAVVIREYKEKQWSMHSVFISPQTGTSYFVKVKGNKHRCYINGFRVPCGWVLTEK